jgi:hypothetical protein
MLRIYRQAAIAAAMALSFAPACQAGEHGDKDCPPQLYSPIRYWAPGAARIYDHFYGPRLSVYAPNRHPEVAPTLYVIRYRCPAVPAYDMHVVRQSPPPESKFRY